ncbi:MAG: alginate lyase family protein [Acetobacteraceae bacterium]|nr:alginate lyase family protein [Acetobacteraceae bacterium]
MKLRWYIRRLRSMEAGEILWRARNLAVQRLWRSRRGSRWAVPPAVACWAGGSAPPGSLDGAAGTDALIALAETVLDGSWPIFATRADLAGPDPDWFRDPVTGRRAPGDLYCFEVPYRDEDTVGNVKHVWELSRLHHVTTLAAAYYRTGQPRFAERALAHLQSWWRANPPLCGIHWVSGIELGIRLIGWVWARRLLESYPGIAEHFEQNEVFQQQLHAHQNWIATFCSRGSSANNHLIAEMSGLLVSSLAFPLFTSSATWAAQAAAQLECESERQTFPDGLNREMASGYHVFVLELLLVAGCEADAAGAPLSNAFWRRVRDMADALAATVDARLATARQGDDDEGRALVLAPGRSATETVLETAARILGPAPWWPDLPMDGIGASLLGSLARRRIMPDGRLATRPNSFPAAGISILRDPQPGPEEIWCRLDHGPHGFLATAAHAHADALSFELRFGGQQIFADPGTYCYHGEPAWRDYFRSTVAHNTLEVQGRDQALQGGPFLWLTRPEAHLIAARGLDGGPVAEVEAEHDGYRDTDAAIIHRRRLVLDRQSRRLDILDSIAGSAPVSVRMAFNLHPGIGCSLRGNVASLSWEAENLHRAAELTLPVGLAWSAHSGETAPILGWYSSQFGHRQPTTLLLGSGQLAPGQVLRSWIIFDAGCAGPKAERIPRREQAFGT